MKQLLGLIVITICSSIKCESQSITIDGNSFGVIFLSDTIVSGTGFVLSSPRTVVTCAHVIDSTKKISFITSNDSKRYILELVKYDKQNDIAVLVSRVDICKIPLIAEAVFEATPRQHLFYLGYSSVKSDSTKIAVQIDNAFVSATGKAISGNGTSDFIEFNGVGIPGYSGGPVLNDNGKVVAMIREAFLKQGIKGGQKQLINRAFSIISISK